MSKKSVENPVWFKTGKKSVYFTWRPTYSILSYWILLGMRNESGKCYRETQNTQFIFNKMFQNCAFFEIERKENGRARQTTNDNIIQCSTKNMWFSYRFTKATTTTTTTHTHTHTHTHTFIIFKACIFATAKMVTQRASMLRYTCLPVLFSIFLLDV